MGYMCVVSDVLPDGDMSAKHARMVYVKLGVKGEDVLEDRIVNEDGNQKFCVFSDDNDIRAILHKYVEECLDRECVLHRYTQVPCYKWKGQYYYRSKSDMNKYNYMPFLE
jgi:hypothetical protein